MFHGIYEIIMFKYQNFLVWRSFFTMNFFTPKSMKIKWSSFIYKSFAHNLQPKLSAHGLNSTLRFLSMSEFKFFLLTGS
jgi:hypothetical protein